MLSIDTADVNHSLGSTVKRGAITSISVGMHAILLTLPPGKLPIQVDDDDDIQQVFSTTTLELPQPEDEKTRKTNFHCCHYQNESAPPLPPKPLAG